MSDRTALATRTLDRCLACGGTELERLPMRYEFRGSFPAAQCCGCGMRFLSVQPAAEAMKDLYSADYFERDFRCGRSESDYFAEHTFREENQGLLEAFAALVTPGSLLEVGCAGGWLLKHAAERGWYARGVELSTDAVNHARALGLDVFHGQLADAGFADASFDLVYMGDVLEHVPDCRVVLAEVARVLKPGGYLYLRGPATTNSLARRVGLALYGMAGLEIVLEEPPYHLWEFTPGPLLRLVRDVGLVPDHLRQSKIAPGRVHGRKTLAQRVAMFVLDGVNWPLTAAFNILGDRLVLVAHRA